MISSLRLWWISGVAYWRWITESGSEDWLKENNERVRW